ncbi:DNA cytosine methyltransferase [Streptomyces sp. enrichment culture]|uniref:DNA cytosine methyltransferase n=1 Tax=Streptomyces sp. enrichment culture TaxID=1795815 RepID=UPI003F545869
MTAGRFSSLEVCAGAGGLALGLEAAGFDPVLLVEQNRHACATLRLNRPGWDVRQTDLRDFVAQEHPSALGVDLMAAGLPRIRSTASTKRPEDRYERELLEAVVWLTVEVQPRVLLIENLPGLVDAAEFEDLRQFMRDELEHLGYVTHFRVLNALSFGVPQDRPLGLVAALRGDVASRFRWPEPSHRNPPTVGAVLWKSMAARGWRGATTWAARADRPAPTVVGGSDRRGGADLGPTGTKKAWARLGVNGASIGDTVPDASFDWDPDGDVRQFPRLTVEQVALLQGFPPDWRLAGGKTARYRQLGHASPPPVAQALGECLASALAEV